MQELFYETYWRDELKEKFPSYKPRTMAGDEYTYTLNPDLQDVKDNEVLYKTETNEDEVKGEIEENKNRIESNNPTPTEENVD